MSARLEDLVPDAVVNGIDHGSAVTVVQVKRNGPDVLTLTYRTSDGLLKEQLLYRDAEARLSIESAASAYSFDADGALFRLGLEAERIHLAYLFDPLMAVHTSRIDPLPHQIEAVYEQMLPRQPLRFLLADDPGAGKTIMAGLFIRELIIRGDLRRCLIIAPGSLVDQWQDELSEKFGLDFSIISRETIENSRSGNPFVEKDLVIARLDQLARNLVKEESRPDGFAAKDWDLVVVDEAHKMAAHYWGNEVKRTRRYELGLRLGPATRHLLLMTATPHSGHDADFQLFMALLDDDRFEGKPRGDTTLDVSDMMRRVVKENMRRFDGRPLFPERRANTVLYELSDLEEKLYEEVTEYVRTEMNRAERLANKQNGRKYAVGFALTTLQRRLASSPKAILRSLERRCQRLQERLDEADRRRRTVAQTSIGFEWPDQVKNFSEDDWENLDDLPDAEVEQLEESLVDGLTAAETIDELRQEIESVRRLVMHAQKVQASGTDRKWEKLSELLQSERAMFWPDGSRRKLIVFTEHKDTLDYLQEKIATLLGRPESVVVIHGGLAREQRRQAQERFAQDKDVSILVATDAAGEGINLQCANLLVDYDLPWNPNRIEQRFGRIHRIGQTEVCYMWNLVAAKTREGYVFQRLFEKLEHMRAQLNGQVFDVLGQVFVDCSLRDLLVDAIRSTDAGEQQARLDKAIDTDIPRRMQAIIDDHALASEVLSPEDVVRVRERMELAEARKLQPYYVGSFFKAAFERLGGRMRLREAGRFEIGSVPSSVRARDRIIGLRTPLLPSYERITFEKDRVAVPGKTKAELVCPGHPLLEAVTDLALERTRPVLQQGTVLVADEDLSQEPRLLLCMEHSVHDGREAADGQARLVSRELRFVEVSASGVAVDAGYAPHLDYRPATAEEFKCVKPSIARQGFTHEVEREAIDWAVQHVVPDHLARIREQVEDRVERTMKAVKERLIAEISYWGSQAEGLRAKELAGKGIKNLNSTQARKRCEELESRLEERMGELELERQLVSVPPVLHGAAFIAPRGFLEKLGAVQAQPDTSDPGLFGLTRDEVDRLAVDAVLAAERALGREPVEQAHDNPGFDILSHDVDRQQKRSHFIEVKGRIEGATTVTVSKNEIINGLNKGDDYVLALVRVSADRSTAVRYVRHPFDGDAGIIFDATSVNFALNKLLAQSTEPR